MKVKAKARLMSEPHLTHEEGRPVWRAVVMVRGQREEEDEPQRR
jgi:hypothetical protein